MSVTGQLWEIERGQDATLRVTGTDGTNPTGWALLFTIVPFTGKTTATYSTTSISISGPVAGEYTFTVPLTRAQTLALALGTYSWDIWRTDTGSNIPLASGTLSVITPARVPV